jgi:CRP-like cAMP-binding protein
MSELQSGSEAERATTVFLASIPLFDGIEDADLAELAALLRRRQLAAGEILWREGDEASGMVLIVDGQLSLSLTVPGQQTVEFGRPGRAEILGEIPLIDGGHHSATVRAVEPTAVLLLRRTDFAMLVSRRNRTAFAIKRRIAGLVCGRLRVQLAALADTLGNGDARARAGGAISAAKARDPAELDFCGPPDSRYVRRLATFRAFDSLALWGFLTAGRYARCPVGETLIAEGTISPACYLTMNGAVEKVIIRGGRRIRVGLAGPGQAFGYESLIDGKPAPTSAITRERTLLLMLPREAFDRLFNGDTAGSHVFIDVVNRDVVAALRQALRPQPRLAASVSQRQR